MKEALARIKINKLLETAGWHFFADTNGPANVQLEPNVNLKSKDLDALGENFEKASKGYIDFVLLNEKSFPFIVLEAKSEDKHPLVGKEHANTPNRKTAVSLFYPTATCIIFGTSSEAIRTFSHRSLPQHR